MEVNLNMSLSLILRKGWDLNRLKIGEVSKKEVCHFTGIRALRQGLHDQHPYTLVHQS